MVHFPQWSGRKHYGRSRPDARAGFACPAHDVGVNPLDGPAARPPRVRVARSKIRKSDRGSPQKGQVWEAALFAAHHKLSRLVAIVDRNGYQLDGAVDDVIGIESLVDKWSAFGWETHEVDGHNLSDLTALLRRVKADTSRRKPCCIVARTVKGKGVSYMETEPGWHLGYLDPSDAELARQEILAREIEAVNP